MDKRNQAAIFIFLEVLLVLVIAVEIGSVARTIVGIETDLPVSAGTDIFQSGILIAAAIFLLAIGYLFVVKKNKLVRQVHNGFSKAIFGSTKQKIFGMSAEVVALLLAELAFAVILAFSIYAYLDPEINLVPWPFNFIAFAVLMGFGLFIFFNTKQFRETTYGQGFLQSKISPAERLFPTRRITNTKTGTIRIGSKKRKKHRK